jgi:hypothetical protein
MTRNYTSYPAQTHLELLIQLGESGIYSADDLERCNAAFEKWIDAEPGPPWSAALKSGQYSSYSL